MLTDRHDCIYCECVFVGVEADIVLQYHGENVLAKYKPKLCIGSVKADAKL